jgi:hypothetical protein
MERMATPAALRTVAGEDSLAVSMRGAFAAARYILTPAFPSESSTAIITLVRSLVCIRAHTKKTK